MTNRICSRCGREKSIRGVWYLTPRSHGAPSAFVCESCFSGVVTTTAPALS